MQIKSRDFRYLRNWRWWAMLPLMLPLGLVAVWGPILDWLSRGIERLADRINYSTTLKSIMERIEQFTAKGKHQ